MKITASPSLSLSGILRLWRGKVAPAAPLNRNLAWTADGRTALAAALRHVGRFGPWLVPAYCCPALRQTFADADIQTEYYAVDESLEPSWDELKDRLEREQAGGILFIHYFGFRTDWAPLKSIIASKAISVIEDCAHLPLPDDAAAESMESDARIYSPRKWLPIPHGGVLMLRDCVRPAQSLFKDLAPAMLPQLLRGCALALERSSGLGLRGWLLSLPSFERRIESGDALGHIDDLSMDPRVVAFIQNSAPHPAVIARKQRAHYGALAERFAGFARGRLWRPGLRAGDCPFTFPLLVEPADQDRVLRHCLRNGILARVYWKRLPQAVMAQGRFEVSRRLSERILCLPVHYQLGPTDLEKIYDVVSASLTS